VAIIVIERNLHSDMVMRRRKDDEEHRTSMSMSMSMLRGRCDHHQGCVVMSDEEGRIHAC
jgi:hypothetical protein